MSVQLTSMTDEERKALFGEPKEGAAAPYNHIKRVVVVMSGKGGVGKTLVTGLPARRCWRNCQLTRRYQPYAMPVMSNW